MRLSTFAAVSAALLLGAAQVQAQARSAARRQKMSVASVPAWIRPPQRPDLRSALRADT